MVFDPLRCIPSASAIEKRLIAIQEEARRLGILLRTAEEIEQGNNNCSSEGPEGAGNAK